MYGKYLIELADNESGHETNEIKAGGSKKKKKKHKKGQKPAAVQTKGTFYCVIMTFFLEELRPQVLMLGHQPMKGTLDRHEILHLEVYEAMAGVYNDKEHLDLKKIPFADGMYIWKNVDDDTPLRFDVLMPVQFSQTLDFLNVKYQKAMGNCRRSGNHDNFPT